MASVRVRRSTNETYLGILILLLLAGIAAGVFLKQYAYDPTIFSASLPAAQEAPGMPPAETADPSHLQSFLPAGMAPMTPMETFGPENLSDKINGKAELYLSAGFVSLHSQRFMDTNDSESWMEVYVYEMGETDNAFAVFSAQSRPDAQKLDLTRFAYRAGNALFFVHGTEYVEIVASGASEETAARMLSFGANLVRANPVETVDVDGLALFPQVHLDESSITLLASDVFGFGGLNEVLTATYTPAGAEALTAFLSVRQTPAEAAELAEAYHRFLVENGGSDSQATIAVPGVKVVEIFDVYEVIFSHGSVLAGVHDAEDRDAAEQLALTLYQRLSEVNK